MQAIMHPLATVISFCILLVYQRIFLSCYSYFSSTDDVNGKQDFIRNGPIKYVFDPSSETETGSIEILFNDDSINEADEGFLLLIEVEKTDQNVAILRGGLTLVILVDEDRK